MAIKIYDKFAPRANPADADYPYGSLKNESVPGAKDGTPLDAGWGNDYAGFDAELFAQAGIVPSGTPDKLGASQRVDAMNTLYNHKAATIINYQQLVDWLNSGTLNAVIIEPITLEDNVTIPAGRKVIFKDVGSIVMGNHSMVWNGEIVAGRRVIFMWNGDQSNSRITGIPQTNEWFCDWFGVVADGVTDWRANGKAYALFKFSNVTKSKVVFTSGFYKTPLDNSESDVTIRCESGVIFAGTVHAAINNDGILNPQLNPKNVRWEGVLRSLERVGTYHCDGVWIDEIYIKDDEANSFSEFSAGVHFFKGTKNLTCPKITVENSKASFAFGLDADDSMLPEGCAIGHVEIISSGVTGAYVRAKNSTIGSINVRNYAQNELADVQNIGLPGFTGDTSKTYGYVNSDSENVEVGNVTVSGSGLSTIAGDGINIGGGTSTHKSLQSRSSNLAGVHVRLGSHDLGKVDSRLSGGDGVVIDAGASVEYSSITSAYNTGKGLTASAALLSGGKIECSFNEGEGASLSGSNCAISYLYTLNNGDGLNNVDATSVSGYIGKVKTERSAVNTGGGLYITGASVGFEYSHESVNDGDSSLYAFFANNASNLTCNGMHTIGSTNQAFRIVNVSDSSFNGVKIPNVDSGASVIGTGLTNVSFMNSNNSSGVTSNIGAADVVEFNSVDMTI